MDLLDDLKEHLPISFYPTKELKKLLKKKNIKLDEFEKLEVKEVYDTGEEGGISCFMEINDKKEGLLVSITHLIIDPAHPLKNQVYTYQKRRIKQLKKSQSF